jgi:hypothetical protein
VTRGCNAGSLAPYKPDIPQRLLSRVKTEFSGATQPSHPLISISKRRIGNNLNVFALTGSSMPDGLRPALRCGFSP